MPGPNFEESWDVYSKRTGRDGKPYDVKETHYPDGRVEYHLWDGPSSDWAKWYDDVDEVQVDAYAAYQKQQNARPAVEQDAAGNKYIWDPNAVDAQTGRKGSYIPAPGLPPASSQTAAAKTMKWSDPNDGSEWIIDSTTGSKIQQLSGAIPGYQPGLGVQRPTQRAERDPSDIEYQQLQSEALRQKMYGGQLFEYDRQTEEEKRRQQEQQWQKTFGLSQAQFDYKKQADEMDRQRQAQELAQRKREAAWAAANDMNNSQLKALPYAAMPGQQYHVGYEPGGIMESIAKMDGRSYNAETYRAPIIQYDPEEAWRKAMGMLGQ